MPNVDISEASLANLDFEGLIMWGSNLRNVVLARANLREADLGALVEVGDLKKATEAANQAMEVAKTIQYVGFMLGRHWVFKVLQEQADRREYP